VTAWRKGHLPLLPFAGMAARLAVGALLLMSILAAGCSSKPAVAGEVAIHGFAFEPASISVPAGKAVRFKNHDSAEHSITADAGGFDQDAEGGGTATVSVDKPGTYAYHCKYHSQMHGTLVFT
jgi:plastocyanin